MAVKQRKIDSIPESAAQRKTRTIGLWLVLPGFLLAIEGLYMLNTTRVMCPANGCNSATLWAIYGPYTVSFFSGQFLIAIGAVTVLYSKVMRIKSEPPRIEGSEKIAGSFA